MRAFQRGKGIRITNPPTKQPTHRWTKQVVTRDNFKEEDDKEEGEEEDEKEEGEEEDEKEEGEEEDEKE